MAYEPGNNASGNNNGKRKEADGFINIYLPAQNGRRKLGFLTLDDSKEDQKKLRMWLEADGDEDKKAERLGKLVNAMIFEYNPNLKAEDKEFVLPED